MEGVNLSLEGTDNFYDEILKTNLSDRKIILNSDITDAILEDVILWILKFNKDDVGKNIETRKKIYIYLCSPGGDAIMGLALLNAIKASTTPVVTVGFGKCASMACYLLAAGTERICFSDTIVLHHDGVSGYYTSGNKGKDIQRFYDSLNKRLTSFLTENTNMTEDFLESIKDREYYMFSDEAKERGIVDKIIGEDVELNYIL